MIMIPSSSWRRLAVCLVLALVSAATRAVAGDSLPPCYNASDSKADNYIPFFSVPNESLNFNFAGGSTNFRLVLGSLWKALGESEQGLAFAYVTITEEGTFRTPHYDAGRAELVYIIQGKARATVTGVGSKKAGKKGGASPSETFSLTAGQAFVAPAGYLHYYEKIQDDNHHNQEPLVALSIYDDATLSSHDVPQILKDFSPHVLAKVLQEPLDEVQGWYQGPRRVYISGSDGSTQSDAIPAEESDFPYVAPPMYMEKAPRSETNGLVETGFWTSHNFKPLALTKFSFAVTELGPGAVLEPYWVDNAKEMVFVITGRSLWVGRGGANNDDSCEDAFYIHEGDLAWHEPEITWYIENRGLEPATLLRVFTHNAPTITTLYDAYHALPPEVRQAML